MKIILLAFLNFKKIYVDIDTNIKVKCKYMFSADLYLHAFVYEYNRGTWSLDRREYKIQFLMWNTNKHMLVDMPVLEHTDYFSLELSQLLG